MSDFWARRKEAVAAEERAEAIAADVALNVENQAAQAEKTDEELLAELELPVPETLGEGDDFKAFLGRAVPQRIKTRALRQLWKVNPVLANLDGLLDYGEDFTDAAMVVPNMQTTYQVGKGMLKHIEEMARQAEAAEAEGEEHFEDEVELVEVEAEIPDQVRDGEALDAAREPAEAVSYEASDEQPIDVAEVPVTRRRMQFTFDEDAA